MSKKYITATFMKFECDSCLCAMHIWEDQTSGPNGRPLCSRCGGTMSLVRFGNRKRLVNDHTECQQ